MSLKVEFFNTPNVEGRKILEYKGVVQASQVAGTGFLTDVFASVSDFLGTNSLLYTDKMNVLRENLFLQLEAIAISEGANAVVGVHVDFDSISNNGSSLFMASIQGTAVVLEKQKQYEVVNGEVDYKMLEKKVFIKNITSKLVNYTYLSEEEWNLIIDSADVSIAESIYNIYMSIDKTKESIGSERWEWVQNFERYFMRLPYDKQVELAYTTTTEFPLIKKFNLFDASKALLWAKKSKLTFAIDCLKAKKSSYTSHDIYEMKELYNYLTNLPNKGKIEEVKAGINPSEIQDAEEYYNYIYSMPNAGQITDAQNEAYSSKVTHFICECGKENDGNEVFCKSCGKNIKGLTMEQVELIEKLKQKISILEELLIEE